MEKGISVVIPAYNEEGSIKETLDQLNEVLDNIEHEIIVVDDNSNDSTSEKIKDYKYIKLIKHTKNKGYGGSITSGIKESNFDTSYSISLHWKCVYFIFFKSNPILRYCQFTFVGISL